MSCHCVAVELVVAEDEVLSIFSRMVAPILQISTSSSRGVALASVQPGGLGGYCPKRRVLEDAGERRGHSHPSQRSRLTARRGGPL